MVQTRPAPASSQSGNILLYVLIGIVLLGLLTVALRMSGDAGKDPDQERNFIKATEIERYAAQLQLGVMNLIQRGVSENDIRFAHPLGSVLYGTITTTPENQVFHPTGGNVEYQLPPANINDGSKWEFFGTSDIPQIGSAKPELIAVLPNLTLDACKAINQQLGFTPGTQPTDISTGTTPDCVFDNAAGSRFTGTYTATPNVLDSTTFSRLPVMQACVACSGRYHYFYVLLAR